MRHGYFVKALNKRNRVTHVKELLMRLKQGSLVKDSFWALFGNIIRQGLALVSGIVVARFLGKEVYGEFGTIRTTLVYVAIVSTFGFGYTATKYVAEYLKNSSGKIKSLVDVIVKITIVFSALLGVVLFLFSKQIALFLDAPHLSFPLKIASPVVVLNALNSTQIGILSGFKAFKEVAKVSAYAGIVTFASSIAFTYWWGLNGAVFALFVSFLFQALLNAKMIRERVRPIKEEGRISLSESRKMLLFSTPIALQESLYTVIHWLNMLVLIKFANYGEVGISSAASLWQSVVIFIPGVLKNVMFSHLVSTVNHKQMVNKLLLVHFVTTIIPVVGVLLFSGVITSFYGENFGGLKPVLIAQVCSAVFICLSEVYCYEFISIGRPWLVFGARMVRDLGIVLVGYLVVISVANQQALAMTFVSMGMNAVFLGVLYGLYGKKTKKEVSL